MIYVLIVSLGSGDLVDLAMQSLHRYAQPVLIYVDPLPSNTTDPRAHGSAIDRWRQEMVGHIQDTDTVVIMDPDAAILSEWWQREMESAFSDPTVGIWGAGSAEDFGPRVHASMMAIRGQLWNFSQATFLPIGTGPWRDTGGFYCEQAVNLGWKVVPVERGIDWNGYSAWWPNIISFSRCVPMWTHLGGGSHSDPFRMTWWQRVRRYQAVRERERFKRLVSDHLTQ